MRWIRVLAGTLLLVVAVVVIYHAYTRGAAAQFHFGALLAGMLLAALAVLFYLHFAYRKALRVMHRGILRAQEGALGPVSVHHFPDRFLRRIVSDHNLLMSSLGSTFAEMEECQNRVIGERNRNEAILDSLPGVLICVDGDLRVNLSNRQAGDLFGLSHDVLLGRNLFDLLALDESSREMMRDAFLYERPIINKEILLHVRRDARYFALNLSFFKSENLNETGAVVIMLDISEYKHLQERTYTMEKLAAMGQLAAGVAHELNTPLGNIIGYARLMDEARMDASQLERYTQIVLHEAKRCARIVDDLLNYARRDHCQLEVCELNTAVKDVVDTIVYCQGKRYEVEVSFDPGPELPVKGSPGQLDIVLVNLLLNAIQATTGGQNPRVTVSVLAQGEREATVIVEDNGPGVPPELCRRIFDPFFTTKEVGKGTGLGLAISQAIVTKLGGSLQYDSTFRQGARFVLVLPLAQLPEVVTHGS
jgi:PAS domain S-box-containing protein